MANGLNPSTQCPPNFRTRARASFSPSIAPNASNSVRLAKLVGNATRQRVDAGAPLLSAGLPGGERVQFALPPAAAAAHVANAIRRPAAVAQTMQQMVARARVPSGRLSIASCRPILSQASSPSSCASPSSPARTSWVRSHRFRQNDLDQGLKFRDTPRGAPDYDRRCGGVGAGVASQSRAVVLLQIGRAHV